MDIPFATRLTTSETVIRIPRMQARPPIIAGSNVIRSKIALVYQPEEQSESPCERAMARGWSVIPTSEVKHSSPLNWQNGLPHGLIPVSPLVTPDRLQVRDDRVTLDTLMLGDSAKD